MSVFFFNASAATESYTYCHTLSLQRPSSDLHRAPGGIERGAHRIDLRVREAGVVDRDRRIIEPQRLGDETDRCPLGLAGFLGIGAVVDDSPIAKIGRAHV